MGCIALWACLAFAVMAAASELTEVPLLRCVNASLGIEWSQQDSVVTRYLDLARAAPPSDRLRDRLADRS